jgi:hypothetical protein
MEIAVKAGIGAVKRRKEAKRLRQEKQELLNEAASTTKSNTENVA